MTGWEKKELAFTTNSLKSNTLRFSHPKFIYNKLTITEHLLHTRYCLLYTHYLIKSSQQAKSYLYPHFPDEETRVQLAQETE